MRMYLPNGSVCKTIYEFVSYYNNQYYWMNKGVIAERRIDELLSAQNGYDENDLFLILAWKIGGINRNQTNDRADNPNREIIYTDNWDPEKKEGKNNGNPIGNENEDKQLTMSDLLEKASGLSLTPEVNWSDAEFIAHPEDAKRILTSLVDVNAQQIGPVYLLTLLYFLTKGRWPIYDKYAYVALKGITEDKNPDEDDIAYAEQMPNKKKNDPQFFRNEMAAVVTGNDKHRQYGDYIEMLKDFEDAYIKERDRMIAAAHNTTETERIKQQYRTYTQSRNIDRALWAYGHMFTIVKPTK